MINNKEYFNKIPISAFREISILRKLNHNNIVKFIDIIYSEKENNEEEEEENSYRFIFYIQMEYIEHDVLGLLAMKIKFNYLQIKYIFYEIVKGINYLHENNIIHRDLKSSNILIGNNNNIKIADFGLSKEKNLNKFLTVRVCTLMYRAPEIIFGFKDYDEKIDVWSLGLLLAELLIGKPFFCKARSFLNLIDIIFYRIGLPTKEEYPQLHEDKYFKEYFLKKKCNYINIKLYMKKCLPL